MKRITIHGRQVIFALFLLVGLWVIGGPTDAEAASCTFGTDCYCDHVKKAADPLFDANLIICEDWEAPTLHDNVGSGTTSSSARGGGGTNAYGPWYDATGFAGGRGYNSYMAKTYPGSGASLWGLNDPASPTVGVTCAFSSCWPGEYRADDLWQGNTTSKGGACIDVIKTGSSNANDEGAELGIPDGPGTNDNRGVWDGLQTFGYRVQQAGSPCGIVGTPSYTAVTDIGITMAVAYGDNSGSLNTITDAHPIKHEQYGNTASSSHQENFLGNVGLRRVDGFPFSPAHYTTSQAACNTALTAATITVGQADCTNAPALRIGTNVAQYTQSTDWPFGKWGCVRVRKSGMGTPNASIKIWYGNGTTETLVFSMTGFDGAALTNQSYNFMMWNSYMNANVTAQGYPGLNGKWRRWIDNVHMRNGEPVSCSQIGFGSVAPVLTNPRQPINLRRAEVENFVELRDGDDYVTRVSR